jgi:catechol 2,3-dioxygenase-like lactoylglutathione lyase family enzyme
MEFRMTNYIAVNVRDYEKSVAFYRDVLGWELVKYTPAESKFKKGDTWFFIAQQDEKAYAVFFEYEVDNLKETKTKLLSEGCTEGQKFAEKSIMFTDPYGMNFHVYEKGTSLPDL